MFTKHEFKFEMFETVRWSYAKWCTSIVGIIVQLVDDLVLKVWILVPFYKSTLSFVEIF